MEVVEEVEERLELVEDPASQEEKVLNIARVTVKDKQEHESVISSPLGNYEQTDRSTDRLSDWRTDQPTKTHT